MSEHRLNIDVHEIAQAIKEIREGCTLIEYIIQQALLEDVNNGNNMDKRVAGVGRRDGSEGN
jgi:hypothetical protein